MLWKTVRLAEAEVALSEAVDDFEAELGRMERLRGVVVGLRGPVHGLLQGLAGAADAAATRTGCHSCSWSGTAPAHSFGALFSQKEASRFRARVPAELAVERRWMNAEYERTQEEIQALNPKVEDPKMDEGLAGGERPAPGAGRRVAAPIQRASARVHGAPFPQPLDLRATRRCSIRGTLPLLRGREGEELSLRCSVRLEGRAGTLPSISIPVGEMLQESVGAFRRQIRPAEQAIARSFRAKPIAYDALIKPAEALISGSDRLLIVPDGPLHTLPWAALARGVKAEQPRYLVEWKPLHTVVSATVYAELKKARRPGPGGPTVELAAFGDPRYPALALRTASVKAGDDAEEAAEIDEDAYGDAEVDAVLRGGYRFEPLPRSRQEVEMIADLYAPNRRRSSASRDRGAREGDRQGRIPHSLCLPRLRQRAGFRSTRR